MRTQKTNKNRMLPRLKKTQTSWSFELNLVPIGNAEVPPEMCGCREKASEKASGLNLSLNLGPEILNSREEVLQGEEWSSEQGQVLDSDLWAQLPSLGILITDHHSYIC